MDLGYSLVAADATGLEPNLVAQVDAKLIAGRQEPAGYWDDLHIWITSDHGHSPVRAHDDLARAIADLGLRVMAHPFLLTIAPQVAVMVSGNAMAHVYGELERRRRRTSNDRLRDDPERCWKLPNVFVANGISVHR